MSVSTLPRGMVKRMLAAAIALFIALPGAAFAQAASSSNAQAPASSASSMQNAASSSTSSEPQGLLVALFEKLVSYLTQELKLLLAPQHKEPQIKVSVLSASVDSASLTTGDSHPLLTGTAENISTVKLVVAENGVGVEADGPIRVEKGGWHATLVRQYTPGSYQIYVYDGGSGSRLFAATLTVRAQ